MKKDMRCEKFNFPQRLAFKLFRRYLTDYQFAKYSMLRWFGSVDIKKPQTFNEKLQWLKLNDRKPHYSDLADKIEVKKVINAMLGPEYITKTLKIWDSVDDISIEEIPSQCVIKTNHGSGGNILVRDKNNFDLGEVKRLLKKWTNTNYYNAGREWVYKDIKPRIFCEELLTDNNGNVPNDFKIFCFNGKAHYIQVDLDRFSKHERIFYDRNWIKQPFNILYPYSARELTKPKCLDLMLDLAEKIAVGIPFARIDFYSLPEIKFGEITFYPENGSGPFTPSLWDLKLGNLIKLEK